MTPKRLCELTEVWCVHPHGEWTAWRDRCSAWARSDSFQQCALCFIHARCVDQCEAWRRALGGHVPGPGKAAEKWPDEKGKIIVAEKDGFGESKPKPKGMMERLLYAVKDSQIIKVSAPASWLDAQQPGDGDCSRGKEPCGLQDDAASHRHAPDTHRVTLEVRRH